MSETTVVAEAPERDRLDEIETLMGRYKNVRRSDILWLCTQLRETRAVADEMTERCDTLLTEVNLLRAGAGIEEEAESEAESFD